MKKRGFKKHGTIAAMLAMVLVSGIVLQSAVAASVLASDESARYEEAGAEGSARAEFDSGSELTDNGQIADSAETDSALLETVIQTDDMSGEPESADGVTDPGEFISGDAETETEDPNMHDAHIHDSQTYEPRAGYAGDAMDAQDSAAEPVQSIYDVSQEPGSSGSYRETDAEVRGTDDVDAVEIELETESGAAKLQTVTEDGVVITVAGDADAFPYPVEELTVTVEEIAHIDLMRNDYENPPLIDEENALEDRAEEALSTLGEALSRQELYPVETRIFDICLWHDGTVIEPSGEVTVTFEGLVPPEENEDFYVYHIDEAADVVHDMQSVRLAEDALSFSTDHFSAYSVSRVPRRAPVAPTDSNTLNTTDNQTEGIHLSLFDYTIPDTVGSSQGWWTNNGNNINIDNYGNYRPLHFTWSGSDNVENGANYQRINRYSGQYDGSGNNVRGMVGAAIQGIVNNTLDGNGYPTLRHGTQNPGWSGDASLAYLFDSNTYNGKNAIYNEVDGLFVKNQDGYMYSSATHYARYDAGTNKINVFGDSSMQDSRTDYMSDSTGTYMLSGDQTRSIGFFPFTDYDSSIADSVNGYYNHHFGMTMTADFLMPKDGKLDSDKDMIFEFSGDDDVWVFIDDVLVLDIGGIHGRVQGTINFATGAVQINNVGQPGAQSTINSDRSTSYNETIAAAEGTSSTTIQQMFANAGRTWNGAEGSEHKISFFYLERGANDSNCSLFFNLNIKAKKDLEIQKTVDDEVADEFRDKAFPFQIYLQKNETLTTDGTVPQLNDSDFELYTGTAKRITYIGGVETEETIQIGADGIFSLKPNQKIMIPEVIADKQYLIRELEVSDRFVSATLTSQKKDGTEVISDPYSPISGGDGSQYFTVSSYPDTVKDNLSLRFNNDVDNRSERGNLTVVKKWVGGDPDQLTALSFILKRTADGQDDAAYSRNFSVKKSDGWQYTFSNLITKGSDGTEYAYYIEESDIPEGYRASVGEIAATGENQYQITVTNTKIPEIAVQKQWQDHTGHPVSKDDGSVEVTLTRQRRTAAYEREIVIGSDPKTFYISVIATGIQQSADIVLWDSIPVMEGQELVFIANRWWENGPSSIWSTNGSVITNNATTVTEAASKSGANTQEYHVKNITGNDVIYVKYQKDSECYDDHITGMKAAGPDGKNSHDGSNKYFYKAVTGEPVEGKTVTTEIVPAGTWETDSSFSKAIILSAPDWYSGLNDADLEEEAGYEYRYYIDETVPADAAYERLNFTYDDGNSALITEDGGIPNTSPAPDYGIPSGTLTVTNKLNEVIVPVNLIVQKMGLEDEEASAFAGTEFSLYSSDANWSLPDGAASALMIEEVTVDTKQTPSEALASFENLTEGYYILKETKAPDGYYLNEEAYRVKVSKEIAGSDQLTVTVYDSTGSIVTNLLIQAGDPQNSSFGDYKIAIEDRKLYELPSTGGAGTYMNTIFGVALFAAVNLRTVRNRRKGDRRLSR